MNYIQKNILLNLFNNTSQTFSSLKPDTLESDLFSYHLRKLTTSNLIIKESNKYSLTTKGIKLIAEDTPLKSDGTSQSTYKVNVLTLCISKGQILLEKRLRKPFLNYISIPGGNINKGELVADAATRICKEKSTLTGMFNHIGTIRKISYFENKDLYQDIYLHVSLCHDLSGDIANSTYKYASFEWYPLEKAIKLESKAKYLTKIYQQLIDNKLSNEFFFVEEEEIVGSIE